ncbi:MULTISPECIES: phosphatase PAP2 family protein [unclassified Streptomyces]|uniref:phosphatase PAP2 family protein n=1 Tax=unclassified Streptomyces TaxID=2593676 RepID=UPI00363BAC25
MRSPSAPVSSPSSPARPPLAGLTGAGAVATLLAVLSGVLTVLVVAEWAPLVSFDRWVAEGLHRRAVAEPGATWANRVLTDWVWDPWTMRLLTAVAVIALWLRRERLLALWTTGTAALGAAVSQGVKAAVGRERPRWPDPVDSAHFAAFPSGHAMTAAVTCGLLLWLARRHGAGGRLWRTAVVVAAVSVAGAGLTRLWLGVHWGTDVMAGWLFGGCLVALSVSVYGRVTLSGKR